MVLINQQEVFKMSRTIENHSYVFKETITSLFFGIDNMPFLPYNNIMSDLKKYLKQQKIANELAKERK